MNEPRPMARLATELTLKRSHWAFLHAAMKEAGWELLGPPVGITTDDGVDTEIRVQVRAQVPLETLANATEPELQLDTLDRLVKLAA